MMHLMQALSRYSKHFVGALRSWTAQLGLPMRMAIQVRRRVAFLTRKWTPLPRYASTVFRDVKYNVKRLFWRALKRDIVRSYPVGWATRAQPVDAQTRAAILALLNAREAGGETLLITACGRGYVKVVEDLLQLIPQHIPASFLEASSLVGWTALHYAVMGGHDEVVNLLLRAGAQANCEDMMRTSPLMYASIIGRVGLVRMLLPNLAVSDLERSHLAGRTALYYAAEGGHEKIIDLLLSHGAQVNNMDLATMAPRMTPLMAASGRGHLGVVQRLLEVVGDEGLEHKDVDGFTALYHAATGGHADVVAFLLSNGAQANSKDMGGWTPLMMASLKGHQAVVQILLQHMIWQGLDDRNMETGAALHLACIEYIAEGIVKPDDGTAEGTVRALLLAGADASATDAEGATPRTLAETRGHSELVAVLDVSGQTISRRGWNDGARACGKDLRDASLICCLRVCFCMFRSGGRPSSSVPISCIEPSACGTLSGSIKRLLEHPCLTWRREARSGLRCL
jgi:ankyrin repeat protein